MRISRNKPKHALGGIQGGASSLGLSFVSGVEGITVGNVLSGVIPEVNLFRRGCRAKELAETGQRVSSKASARQQSGQFKLLREQHCNRLTRRRTQPCG